MPNLLVQASQLIQSGEYSAAETLCRKAISKPALAGTARRMLADCLYNKGMMHVTYSGMMDAAEEAFAEALTFNPAHVLSLNNLGVLKSRTGDLEAAVGYYLRALKSDARHVDSLKNLAVAYQRLDRLDEAEKILERLVALDPANAGLYLLRNALLIRSIIPDADYPARARLRMEGLLDECMRCAPAAAAPESFAMPYFYLSYHGLVNKEVHRKIARAYLHLWPGLAWTAPAGAGEAGRQAQGRLRIGIASSNLFNHSIGHTSRGLVEQLDRARFEVIVIRLGPSPRDAVAEAIDTAADRVLTVSAGDLQGARVQIAALSLDILFYQDIGMDPFSYLLGFARLAPVQLTSFGHPDTTGLPNMDCFISSARYELPGAQEHYSEKLLLVPEAGTLSYYHRPEVPADDVPRGEFGLSDDEHVYLCPQTLFKMHPDMDAVFGAVCERDPVARIVLIEPAQRHMREALERRFSLLPDGTAQRIRFIARMPHDAYLRLMRCADVILDTVHFNGQNTNLEAFAMALPVVTWPGMMQRERHTVGMIDAMGHALAADLVAHSAADYAARAVRIAVDRPYRDQLRHRIAQASSVLYRDAGFIRDCEKLLIQIAEESPRADEA